MKGYINGNDRYNVTKIVGRYTYGDELITIKEPGADLTIGSFCAIGQSVKVILGSYHRVDWITSFPFGQNSTEVFTKFNHLPYNSHNVTVTNGDIVIGNDVWLGDCVTIMSGVTIGHGCVIGAHSVVAKDIPPYSVVVGNPGKVIRKKFNDDDIEFLLNLKWWDLQDNLINEITPILCSGNIQKLREYFETNQKIYIDNPINKKLILDWNRRIWSDGTNCPIGYNT